jgi:beta-N-acetylhexosaminidase
MVTGSGAGFPPPGPPPGPRRRWVALPAARVWLIAVAAAVVVAVVVTLVVVAGGTPGRRDSAGPTTSADTPSATPTGQPATSTVPTTAGPSTAPSAPPPTRTEAQRAEACVQSTLVRLPLAARVGQLLMIGAPATSPQSLAAAVREDRLGGVFLHGRSAQSAATVRAGIQRLQTAAAAAGGIGLQIAVDQEGGLVQTLRGAGFPRIPSAVEQGRMNLADLRTGTTDWARRLAAAGVTLDLAPVADTVPAGFAASNPPIGAVDRQYGSTPDRVAADVRTVVTAAQAAGVLTTLKHFPGLGRVRANTDTASTAVDPTTTADDPYLTPFGSGIRAGSAAVMVSSARYPRLDSQSIAAFSSEIVTGLLRDRLGFTGLVISDDLGAAAAVRSVSPGQRAVRFVRAGGDMVLTVRPGDAQPMITALLAAARASAAFGARVTDAARHVLRSKYRAGQLRCAGDR